MFVAILIREAYWERHIICMVTNSKHKLKKKRKKGFMENICITRFELQMSQRQLSSHQRGPLTLLKVEAK